MCLCENVIFSSLLSIYTIWIRNKDVRLWFNIKLSSESYDFLVPVQKFIAQVPVEEPVPFSDWKSDQ